MDRLQLFMHLYMYELEIWLNEHREEIFNISFQSDEANTDRPLKEYLKHVIETECNCIVNLNRIKGISDKESYFPITDDIRSIYIARVLLPEDINQEIRTILQSRKNAVFTKPDLCLVLNINGTISYETLELKSTKTDAIPGSSVQQISPEEWVIFIKHGRDDVKIATGQYYHAINSKMPFPDRSPRPQVSFSELQNWNDVCRDDNGTTIIYTSMGDELLKKELLEDWQGVLAERWTKIVLSKPGKCEPWFNNNLRKFVFKFLKYYDAMPLYEKEQYKEFLFFSSQ